jgi:hypothetical protein
MPQLHRCGKPALSMLRSCRTGPNTRPCVSLQQELGRFPRMHAQLVEAVSELLRERLGPTSEYVSSLIGIQAAYINTNHPEFVAGSAAIARGELPAGQNVPIIKQVS